MAGTLTAPFPYETPVSPEIVDKNTGKKVRSPYFSQEHIDWWLEQQTRVEESPAQIGRVSLTAQGASIGATSIGLPAVAASLYRVSYIARISRAGSVSSSLTVTFGWTRSSVSISQAGAAITGNTTATQQNGTLTIRVDANSPLTYSTTYADGGGATSMQYELDVRVEKLPD